MWPKMIILLQMLLASGVTEAAITIEAITQEAASSSNCTFNGTTYSTEESLVGSCLNLICVGGTWYPTGFSSITCSMCSLRNDPHFTGFSGFYYDFHGILEYYIAMNIDTYGVTADFYPCNSFASCLDIITYKDNADTVIQFYKEDGNTIFVNSVPFPVTNAVRNVVSAGSVVHPVLAWKQDGCIRIVGTRGIAVSFCIHDMYVWAENGILGDLDGLCFGGRKFGAAKSKHSFQRLAVSQGEINEWGESLLVSGNNTRPFESTAVPGGITRPFESTTVPVLSNEVNGTCDSETEQMLRDQCQDLFNTVSPTDDLLNVTVDFCVVDLCLMTLSNATQDEIDDWKMQMVVMLENTVQVINHTIQIQTTTPAATVHPTTEAPTRSKAPTTVTTVHPTTEAPTRSKAPTITTVHPTTEAPTRSKAPTTVTTVHPTTEAPTRSKAPTTVTTVHPMTGPHYCTFDGKIYANGETIENSCLILVCAAGNWQPTGRINNTCSMCSIRNDPHFIDFFAWAFDFHGTDNYAIAKNADSSGVTADFYGCYPLISCLDIITYKDDAATVITFNRNGGNTIHVNGSPFIVTNAVQNVESAGSVVHPVLAWKHNSNCIRIVGTRGIALAFCGWEMYVWAQTAILGGLEGLCLAGPTFDPANPPSGFTILRVPQEEINEWGESLEILGNHAVRHASSSIIKSYCDSAYEEELLHLCLDLLHGASYNGHPASYALLQVTAQFCKVDLCIMTLTNATQEAIDEWKVVMVDMLENTVEVIVSALPPGLPPDHEEEQESEGSNGIKIRVVQEVNL
ncbi:uncharacterized protein LOC125041404 isoform X6 [Penaeus chinensis]|uniref:uncharacterized protein LOC125041404 isoform X6 n=1 Tax=Penaeus chinensis TaxID=139456 RepID=UPI001FB74FE9|nr:uncharacterized protein LOC125041404 isoform X6 [Penaeus chinensis]